MTDARKKKNEKKVLRFGNMQQNKRSLKVN